MDTKDKLMRRALMWINPYGHQAVRRKLKKGVKTLKFYSDDYPDFQQKAQK